MTQTAVLMMAYGGPDSLDDIEPYLLDVRGGRATPPELVEEIRERYAAIGGKSPLLEITTCQARALEAELRRQGFSTPVFVGMRHWHPYIPAVVNEIAQTGVERLVTICMTPFASRMTTAAYGTRVREGIEALPAGHPWRGGLELREIGAWYDNPRFVEALAAKVRAGLAGLPEGAVVAFTAHSLPAALTEQGDPYAAQFADLTGRAARAAGLADGRWQICYQSAGASGARWLGPSLDETLENLAQAGEKAVLVAPIGFLADHVEILYDIDIETQAEARAAGITLARTASLNDDPLFIEALAQIVRAEAG